MTGTTSSEASENVPVEDLICECEKPALAPSSNDSGFANGVIDDNGSSTRSFGTNSSDESQEPHEVSLMVHITEEKCQLTIIYENGTVQYYAGNDTFSPTTGRLTIPMKLGIVRQRILVFGDEVSCYEDAQSDKADFLKKYFFSFALGKHLLDHNSSSPMKFIFDDDVVHGKVELLMGLFLGHLKDLVRKFLNSSALTTSYQLSQIYIVVPIGFTSLYRQRLKDSALIAGFDESFIINETEVPALVHLAARKHAPGIYPPPPAMKCQMPFHLHQTQTVSGRYKFKINENVSKDSDGKFIAYMEYPMERSTFYQKNALGEQCEVGTIQVKPLFYYDHCHSYNLEIHVNQSHDGIFTLDSVQACNPTTNCTRNLESESGEFLWLPANLRTKEKVEFSEKLREMQHCSNIYQLHRSNAKDELFEICVDIADRLWSGEHRRLARDKKLQMEKKVMQTLEMLKKMSMNQLMEIGRDEIRRNLRVWRRDYDTFFVGC